MLHSALSYELARKVLGAGLFLNYGEAMQSLALFSTQHKRSYAFEMTRREVEFVIQLAERDQKHQIFWVLNSSLNSLLVNLPLILLPICLLLGSVRGLR